MKNLLKLFALAAAFGMAPAAASAQAPAAAASAPAASGAAAAPVPGQAPRDAISANSQAKPAQPEQASTPSVAGANFNKTNPADATVANSALAAGTAPTVDVGQPKAASFELQKQFTPIGEEARWFHNTILLPLITVISLFVLALLLFVIVRFRRGAHPIPSRNTHNTLLEIVWTLVPVLILVAIAVPSIKLLAHQYSPPKPDLTIKVTGNQWYWTYGYPDNGGFEIVSNMLSKEDDAKRGEPRLLGVDERMVVPQGAVVKLIVTSADVIHSWGVPSFWVKMDAVPGRLNETWFKVDKPGVYYGVCYELCGARHPFMPIAVDVVPRAQFDAWVASKGGKPSGAAKPTSSDATQNSKISNPAPAAGVTTAPGGGTSATPTPTNVSAGTAAPTATNQSQAQSSRGH
jgi:cytochrome c oxidase subunit 2